MKTAHSSLTVPQQQLRAELILEHLPRVRKIASRIHAYLPCDVCLEDLVSTGILGLIVAIDNFDPRYNVRLQTYATYRIRGAILDSIRRLDGVLPHHRPKIKKVRRAVATLESTLGRTPSTEEIAASLGISVEEYYILVRDTQGPSVGSLDNPRQGSNSVNLADRIADHQEHQPDRLLEEAELNRLLDEGIAQLPAIERYIVRLYYREGRSLTEIAQQVHLHVSRISQLKRKATAFLRSFIEERWQKPGKPGTKVSGTGETVCCNG